MFFAEDIQALYRGFAQRKRYHIAQNCVVVLQVRYLKLKMTELCVRKHGFSIQMTAFFVRINGLMLKFRRAAAVRERVVGAAVRF